MSSPNMVYSGSSSTSSTNFFAKKSLFKLFSKKSLNNTNNKKSTSNIDSTSKKQRIPFIATTKNSQTNDTNNLILVELILKRTSSDYGFTISGYCPCQVDKIEQDSIAIKAGLQIGDLIIKVNSNNVTRASIESIVKMIKNSNDTIILSIYRNATKNQQQQNPTPKLLIQGDQAATGIINSTENDFFMLSKSSDSHKRHLISEPNNDKNLLSNLILNQQEKYQKFLKTNPIESFKSDDFLYYAGGSGVSINYNNKKHKKINKKVKNGKNDSKSSSIKIIINDLPSPIPYLPPLCKKKKRQNVNDDDNNLNNIKKSTLTDSDYKTQSSSTTDIASSSNDYRLINQQQKINNDFELDVSVDMN
jgi:hypothetical protein